MPQLSADRAAPRQTLSAYQLKWIAITAMLLDHIGWAFVPTASLGGQLIHIVGRLTAPIMAYLLAEGYYHTRSVKKYLLRMGVFALISAPAFSFYEAGGYWRGMYGFGMIYTLFLGLLAIAAWEKKQWPAALRICLVALLCALSTAGDWMIVGVLWPLVFAIYRGQPRRQYQVFGLVAAWFATWLLLSQAQYTPALWWSGLCQYGTLLAIPLLARYNGTLGGGKGMKWLFYVFYPAHLVLLGVLQRVL